MCSAGCRKAILCHGSHFGTSAHCHRSHACLLLDIPQACTLDIDLGLPVAPNGEYKGVKSVRCILLELLAGAWLAGCR
jgi:hypothetical protein